MPSTTYYFRAKADSGSETVYGSTANFTTLKELYLIIVTPANPTIAKGRGQQFTATGNYTDNSQANLTANVTWSSSNTTVATIAAGGLAQSYEEGSANITATLGSISGNTTLYVDPKALDTLAITPDNPTIADGRTQQFSANGTYSDLSTEDITASVAWASSNGAVATIGLNDGLAQGLAEGQTTIFAVSGNATDTTTLTVSAKVLDAIAVTSDNLSIAAGYSQQFSATGEVLYMQKDIKLPEASHGQAIEVAPVIAISAEHVVVTGQKVADVRDLEQDALFAIPPLEERLRDEKKRWDFIHQNDPDRDKNWKGDVNIQADVKVPFRLLKRVMFSAAQAGYFSVNFATLETSGSPPPPARGGPK